MAEINSQRTGNMRTCPICKTNFYAKKSSKQTYCSRSCANKARSKKKIYVENEVKRECLYCQKEFLAKPNLINKGGGKYCSLECFHKGRTKSEIHKCLECGKEFKVPRWKIKKGEGNYCSRKCYNTAKKNRLRVNVNCEYCGKSFKVPAHLSNGERKRKFCSHICYVNSKEKYNISKVCKFCGKTFKVLKSHLKSGKHKGEYCSRECRINYNRKIINCAYCGKEYETTQGVVDNGRTMCSIECRDKARIKRVTINCEICGKEFEVKPYLKGKRKCCSPKCLSIYHSRSVQGENHPNWQGGISFEPYCFKFREEFKERVRKFWNRTCGLCGKSEKENGKRLCVHHVTYDKKVCCNDILPLFIPLCNVCHSKTNSNRKYWHIYFTNYIMIYFDGASFLPK